MLLSEDIIPLSVLGCKRSISQWDYIERGGGGLAYHPEAFCKRLGGSFRRFGVVNLLQYKLDMTPF